MYIKIHPGAEWQLNGIAQDWHVRGPGFSSQNLSPHTKKKTANHPDFNRKLG